MHFSHPSGERLVESFKGGIEGNRTNFLSVTFDAERSVFFTANQRKLVTALQPQCVVVINFTLAKASRVLRKVIVFCSSFNEGMFSSFHKTLLQHPHCGRYWLQASRSFLLTNPNPGCSSHLFLFKVTWLVMSYSNQLKLLGLEPGPAAMQG